MKLLSAATHFFLSSCTTALRLRCHRFGALWSHNHHDALGDAPPPDGIDLGSGCSPPIDFDLLSPINKGLSLFFYSQPTA